eukprot:scaffold1569_cov171-Amphora_coffeaeformis.AAC.18
MNACRSVSQWDAEAVGRPIGKIFSVDVILERSDPHFQCDVASKGSVNGRSKLPSVLAWTTVPVVVGSLLLKFTLFVLRKRQDSNDFSSGISCLDFSLFGTRKKGATTDIESSSVRGDVDYYVERHTTTNPFS